MTASQERSALTSDQLHRVEQLFTWFKLGGVVTSAQLAEAAERDLFNSMVPTNHYHTAEAHS